MNRSHLSDDELIAFVYGIGDAEGHLEGCPECRERFTAMRKIRAESVDTTKISGRMLAAQRQRVLERLEAGSHTWRWVPAAAAAALLAVALFLSRPAGVPPQAPAAVNAETDAELFTDVYSMERNVEPRAAAPIRALFQETSFEPAAAGQERQ